MTGAGKLIDRIFACAGAFTLAQFPQFYLQYTHELSGHVKELQYQVSQIEHAAVLSNKTLMEWVEKFHQNPDPDFSLQGELLKGMVMRLSSFQEAELTLTNSSIWLKPFMFMQMGDKQIAYDTFTHFKLGFAFTVETLVYAFIGLVLGHLIYCGISACLKKVKTSSTLRPKRS
jgi:hypothetical protein